MRMILTSIALLVLPVAALAGDDCHAPRELWQPREAALAEAARLGWQVGRLKLDDGCYEIKGTDAAGRRFKAKLDPATLRVVSLRQKDGGQGGRDDDDDGRARAGQGQAPASPGAAPPANPLFQGGAAPVVRVN